MATEDGRIKENDGKTVEDLVKEYIPVDNDAEPDSSDEEEENIQNEANARR